MMRCANCGHELKDDEIYCVKCGKALQLVPDYNALEDETLPYLLSEHTKQQGTDSGASGIRRLWKKPLFRFALIVAVVAGVCAIARFAAPAQTQSEAEEVAEAQESKPPAEEAYSIKPVFSPDGGIYTEDVSLELSSPDGADVYYTTDGTDPTSHNGSVFEQPILLKSGETTVRAASFNEEGKIGPIVEEVYTVSYQPPDMPRVTPVSGTYHEETYVTVSTNADAGTVYYTWDGTNPTMDSMSYTGPILIPEGNHVLSLIVIDAHGMASDILRCNYVYIP